MIAYRIKLSLSFLLVTFSLVLAPRVLAASVSTNPLDKACAAGTASNGVTCKQATAQGTNNPIAGPNGIINTAANIIALVAGIGAVIVIIISGFLFVTAGGAAPGQRAADPNRLKTARSALSGAIIGLVVIALSWAIVQFVTTRLIQ